MCIYMMMNRHTELVIGCILVCQVYVYKADVGFTDSPSPPHSKMQIRPSISSTYSEDNVLTPSFSETHLNNAPGPSTTPLEARRTPTTLTSNKLHLPASHTIMLYSSESHQDHTPSAINVTQVSPSTVTATVANINSSPSTTRSPVHAASTSMLTLRHKAINNTMSDSFTTDYRPHASADETPSNTKVSVPAIYIPSTATVSHSSSRSVTTESTSPIPTVTRTPSASRPYDKELVIIFVSTGGLMLVTLVACLIRKKLRKIKSDRFIIGGGDINIELSRF